MKARNREFKPGDKVLLLLPTDNNKLLMHWKGPFEVLEKIHGHNYRIQLPDRVKMFHANMLKLYVERQEQDTDSALVGAAVVECDEGEEETLVDYALAEEETFKDVKVNSELSEE